jgi:hypothetical protein
MDSQEEIDQVAKEVAFLAVKQRFQELGPIVQVIFGKEDRLGFLVDLANRLSGAFEKLCLIGLPRMMALDETDYIELFELARGRDIAMYNLTGFLLTHGGASKRVLQHLCKDFGGIQKIKQFKPRLDRDSPPPEESVVNERLYKYLNVPTELVEAYRGKIAGMI